jgi:hypothetical protein
MEGSSNFNHVENSEIDEAHIDMKNPLIYTIENEGVIIETETPMTSVSDIAEVYSSSTFQSTTINPIATDRLLEVVEVVDSKEEKQTNTIPTVDTNSPKRSLSSHRKSTGTSVCSEKSNSKTDEPHNEMIKHNNIRKSSNRRHSCKDDGKSVISNHTNKVDVFDDFSTDHLYDKLAIPNIQRLSGSKKSFDNISSKLNETTKVIKCHQREKVNHEDNDIREVSWKKWLSKVRSTAPNSIIDDIHSLSISNTQNRSLVVRSRSTGRERQMSSSYEEYHHNLTLDPLSLPQIQKLGGKKKNYENIKSKLTKPTTAVLASKREKAHVEVDPREMGWTKQHTHIPRKLNDKVVVVLPAPLTPTNTTTISRSLTPNRISMNSTISSFNANTTNNSVSNDTNKPTTLLEKKELHNFREKYNNSNKIDKNFKIITDSSHIIKNRNSIGNSIINMKIQDDNISTISEQTQANTVLNIAELKSFPNNINNTTTAPISLSNTNIIENNQSNGINTNTDMHHAFIPNDIFHSNNDDSNNHNQHYDNNNNNNNDKSNEINEVTTHTKQTSGEENEIENDNSTSAATSTSGGDDSVSPGGKTKTTDNSIFTGFWKGKGSKPSS